MPGRKSLQTVGKPMSNGNGSSRKGDATDDPLADATSPRRGKGGVHGVPKGFYARTADPEAKQAADEMRTYFRTIVQMLMKQRDMTQLELAEKMGVGLGTIKDKLAGRSGIDIGEANQLAAILGVELHVLVNPKVSISELWQLKPPYPNQSCFSPNAQRTVATESDLGTSVGFPIPSVGSRVDGGMLQVVS